MEASLEHFLALMEGTLGPRRAAVEAILAGDRPPGAEFLRETRAQIEALPQDHRGRRILTLYGDHQAGIDVSYELTEIEKDIIFLEEGEDRLVSHLQEHGEPKQVPEVAAAAERLRNRRLRVFITDRDGTINNYCARYRSSVQSIYNAVFVSRFVAPPHGPRTSIILTSAPLTGGGLADVSVMPAGSCILAGSKGREYLHPDGGIRRFEIEAAKQKKLDELNRRLAGLLERSEYRHFAYIGSGLQFKYGQTTVSRQDYQGSVPRGESESFKAKVLSILQDVDPGDQYFRLEDTGKDLEIMLTVSGSGKRARDFDKGDGIVFLASELDLRLEEGGAFVCGDTPSDVPMVEAVSARSRDYASLFVHAGDELRSRVSAVDPEAIYLSSPDTLVLLLGELSGSRERGS